MSASQPKRQSLAIAPLKKQRSKELIEERVTRFYAKYAPEKLPQIEFLLPLFLKDEDAAFAQVTSKYGPEPLAEGTRERISAFYQYYAPEKLPDLERLLLLCAGKDDESIDTMIKKYGPEPKQPQFRARVERFYAFYAPNRLQDIDRLLPMMVGCEDETMSKLIVKYGPEPRSEVKSTTERVATAIADAPSLASHNIRERLVRFYTFYAPEKLADVDQLLPRIVGLEEETFLKLVEKYGPEPRIQSAAAEEPNSSDINPTDEAISFPARAGTRERLIRFYEHYAPAKLDDVDRLLPMFAGIEDETFVKLVVKYGPEPPLPLPEVGLTDDGPAPRTLSLPDEPDRRVAVEYKDDTVPIAILREGTRERLVRFYNVHCPAKVADIDRLLPMMAGYEDETFEKLIAKYGPEPDFGRASVATENVDAQAGEIPLEHRPAPEEASAFPLSPVVPSGTLRTAPLPVLQPTSDILVLAVHPSPQAVPDAVPQANLPQAAPAEVRQGTRERLARFYTHHAPDKLDDVDRLLPMMAGFEDETFLKLVLKYGPEPRSSATQIEAPTNEVSHTAIIALDQTRALMNHAISSDIEHQPNPEDNVLSGAVQPLERQRELELQVAASTFLSRSTSIAATSLSSLSMVAQPEFAQDAPHFQGDNSIEFVAARMPKEQGSEPIQSSKASTERSLSSESAVERIVVPGSLMSIDAIDIEWRKFVESVTPTRAVPSPRRSQSARQPTSQLTLAAVSEIHPATDDASDVDSDQQPTQLQLAACVIQSVGRGFLTRRSFIARVYMNFQAKLERRWESNFRQIRSIAAETHARAERTVARACREFAYQDRDRARKEHLEVVHSRQSRSAVASAAHEVLMREVERQAMLQQRDIEDLARQRRRQQGLRSAVYDSFGGRSHVESILLKHEQQLKKAAVDMTLEVAAPHHRQQTLYNFL
ncbi:Hypothetical protein, putative [Bodo saltans]|uniref:Uncharacterized protein n=1 Tax=Bodo saltans TaxID=75058 RepID=A0A0S4JFT2_BODSA|nr:Hypothetical protein, putative [Bodo saltans]|eukprot:CUG90344.1 Hypothetical protein, putative [Bodo saltans]